MKGLLARLVQRYLLQRYSLPLSELPFENEIVLYACNYFSSIDQSCYAYNNELDITPFIENMLILLENNRGMIRSNG